jgi:uncharacterized protein YjbI with pentapeptide repeats
MSDDKPIFSLAQYQQSEKSWSSLKKIHGTLSDFLDLVKDSGAADGLKSFAPWAKDITEAGGETFAVVKFILSLIDKRKSHLDPLSLGHIALTTAYQWAADKAIREIQLPEATDKSAEAMKEAHEFFKSMEPTEDVDLSTFLLEFRLDHPLIKKSETYLEAALRVAGFSDDSILKIIERTRDYFNEKLDILLSQTETRDKFQPFRDYSKLGATERQAHVALIAHAEYQRWLFQKYPVLGKAPFALGDVFIEPECGVLEWGKIKKDLESQYWINKEKIDPFLESYGGRHLLLDTVMDLIANPKFTDAIIIQGIAGTGKSSFTLKLCDELIKNEFRPIRIRLRDVDLSGPVSESLPTAIKFKDEEGYCPFLPPSRPDDLFLGNRIFKETKSFRGTQICRYVLILDGWDEITMGVTEGFKIRVDKMLEQIRSQYLTNRDIPIRVILTGRPTSDVINTHNPFLHNATRILTIRPLSPDKLQMFAEKIEKAVEVKPVQREEIENWKPLELKRVNSLIKLYKEEFTAHINADDNKSFNEGIGIIGLPLLAYLTFRLMAEWQGDPEELVKNPTTLYRNLIDFTCGKGGKAFDDTSNIEKQARFLGNPLRRLLHQTAAAMTALGRDAIRRSELQARLSNNKTVEKPISGYTKENVLSSLVISFYFKSGGPDLGCEFAHKSFREYLFAESVIETLKDYGRRCQANLPEKSDYWKDFNQSAPQHNLSRELGKLLAPQWLTPEIVRHLNNLIQWEINRPLDNQPVNEAISITEPLDIGGWRRIRDGLADLWDWWGEGVHLRPIIKRENVNQIVRIPAFVEELIKHSIPLYIPEDMALPIQMRSTTMDGHLGDGLCRLCAYLHYYIFEAENRNKPDINQLARENPPKNIITRKYQSEQREGERTFILFKPSGEKPEYFKRYSHRINSAGWRPDSDFPASVFLSKVNLSNVSLERVSLDRAILNGAILDHAILDHAILVDASLDHAILNGASLIDARLDRAILNGAILNGAILIDTRLNDASLVDASLIDARLDRASLIDATLDDAIFDRASLVGVRLDSASLVGAILIGARLDHATLDRAILNRASLFDASLVGASLVGASLIDARLDRARLDHARLDRAFLDRASLDRASLDRASLIGASLDRASLDRASLDRASLIGASLIDTSLDHTILNRAIVDRTNFELLKKMRVDVSSVIVIQEPEEKTGDENIGQGINQGTDNNSETEDESSD